MNEHERFKMLGFFNPQGKRPVNATETPNQLKSKDPHSSLAASVLTGPVWHLKNYLATGNSYSKGQVLLKVAESLENHAPLHNWRLTSKDYLKLAEVALYRFEEKKKTNSEELEILGRSNERSLIQHKQKIIMAVGQIDAWYQQFAE